MVPLLSWYNAEYDEIDPRPGRQVCISETVTGATQHLHIAPPHRLIHCFARSLLQKCALSHIMQSYSPVIDLLYARVLVRMLFDK